VNSHLVALRSLEQLILPRFSVCPVHTNASLPPLFRDSMMVVVRRSVLTLLPLLSYTVQFCYQALVAIARAVAYTCHAMLMMACADVLLSTANTPVQCPQVVVTVLPQA
jgi:hypothetical protein